jgi:hypothetical protein
MTNQRDPHAVSQPSKAGDAPPHDPRVPGAHADEQEGRDHPNKPFRTPNKTKTHPAPERGTDGEPGEKKN